MADSSALQILWTGPLALPDIRKLGFALVKGISFKNAKPKRETFSVSYVPVQFQRQTI